MLIFTQKSAHFRSRFDKYSTPVMAVTALYLFRFPLEYSCSNKDDLALYSTVLLLQHELHAATVRMCKKWLWRGPWFECK